MPNYDSLKQRIEILERTIDRMELQRDVVEGRLNNTQPIRLAYTTTSGTYPSDPSTAFEFIFIDGFFTEFPGTPSPTWTDRATTAKRVGYTLGGHIEENSVVAVFRQNGRYWLLPTGAGTNPPGEGGGEQLVNVFHDPEYYFLDGPDAGTAIADDPNVIFGESVFWRRESGLGFNVQSGPDMGIVHDGTNNRFAFTQEGQYLIGYTAQMQPVKDTGGSFPAPTSHQDFSCWIQTYLNDSLTGLNTPRRFAGAVFNSEFTVTFTGSHDIVSNLSTGLSVPVHGETLVEVRFTSSGQTQDTLYLEMASGNLRSPLQDFGVKLFHPQLHITKLYDLSEVS